MIPTDTVFLRRCSGFLAVLFGLATVAPAAIPFDSATVSKIENSVEVGDRTSGAKIAAQLQQAVEANNFVVTEDKSRAELTFPDGSLARVGQNTVFTFDSARTLELQKGAMLIYVPPKSGGATTIKTHSLTAAITGTIVLVADNLIAVLVGQVTLPDGRVVHAGEAVEYVDGELRIFEFDPTAIPGGYLVQMGELPESPYALPADFLGSDIPQEILRLIERGEITQVDPRVRVPKPKKDKVTDKKDPENDQNPYSGPIMMPPSY